MFYRKPLLFDTWKLVTSVFLPAMTTIYQSFKKNLKIGDDAIFVDFILTQYFEEIKLQLLF